MMTILVVDDDCANVALISRVMSLDGYHVVSAPDGESALDYV